MATTKQPDGVPPPKCACGCEQPVRWKPGVGWLLYAGRGHALRGKVGWKAGTVTSVETKEKQRKSALARYAGRRLRDVETAPGLGVYSTAEYQKARQDRVVGKPCAVCGVLENIHAHHMVPGDDETVIPLCAKHHQHAHHAKGKVKGDTPPKGEDPPLCACGCGQCVKWKRVRGWATYARGHANAKVPAVAKLENAPFCLCGCKEYTTFRHGVGWNQFKRGHQQRVLGDSFRNISRQQKDAIPPG